MRQEVEWLSWHAFPPIGLGGLRHRFGCAGDHAGAVFQIVRRLPAPPGTVERGLTLEATAHAIPRGALVEVRFAGKQSPDWLRGRIGQAGSQEFQIQVLRSGIIDVRTLRFDEVESLKPVDSLWVESAPAKVVRVIGTSVAIAVTSVLVLAIVLVIAARTGHLGG